MAHASAVVSGASVDLIAPRSFIDFVECDFRNFSSGDTNPLLPRLNVEIYQSQRVWRPRNQAKFVGSHTWIIGNELLHNTTTGLQVSLRATPQQFDIACRFGKSALAPANDVTSLFQRMLRWTIQWPLMEILERFDSWNFLHASAVESDGRVLILMGESGVGKSTTAQLLSEFKLGKVVADNFVGVKRDLVSVLPETWRVGDAGDRSFSQVPCRYALGKFHFPLDSLCAPGSILAYVALTRGADFSAEPLSSRQIRDFGSRLRSKSREFPESGYLFALPLILSSQGDEENWQHVSISRPSFMMAYDKAHDQNLVIAWLRDLFELL